MDTTFMNPDWHDPDNESSAMDKETLQDTEFYAESFLQNAIFMCGIAFNAINIHILRSINLGDNYRICLISLSTCDLFACIFGVAQLTLEGVFFRSILPFGYWHDSAYVVYFLYYVFMLFMCTSSAYVILIAIVRSYTLRQPIKSMALFTVKRVKRACVGILITTMVLFSPTPLYGVWQNCYKDISHPKCKPFFDKFPNAEKLRYYFYLLSLIFGPFVILTNIVCLIVMKRSLKKGRHTASEKFNRRPQSLYKMFKRHSKITRTLAIILVLDTVWILPTCIQYVLLVLSPQDTIFKSEDAGYKIFDLVSEILLAVRPTYNLFVYLVTNTDFRRKFRRTFCYCCCVDGNSSGTTELINTPTQTRRKSSVPVISPVISPHHAILRDKNRDVTNDATVTVKKQISWHADKVQQEQECSNDVTCDLTMTADKCDVTIEVSNDSCSEAVLAQSFE